MGKRVDDRVSKAKSARNTTGLRTPYQTRECRMENNCKYKHQCWQCLEKGHGAIDCPIKPIRISGARANTEEVCIRWNLTGCKMSHLCRFRHVCLFCEQVHPLRHSTTCLAKFYSEVQ